MRVAITRAVSSQIGRCELSFLDRSEINLELARAQHRWYEDALAALGCSLLRLPEEPDMPDSVFVEDTAIVLDELALITRPGALSRRAETGSVAAALGRYRTVEAMQDPAVADGGDVLCVGKSIFTGISRRTNEAAVRKLQESTAAFRYTVKSVAVRDCLHLKSAVTRVAEDTLLLNPHWVDAGAFRGFRCLEVDPREPQAANALLVGRTVLYPLAFPATRRRLEDQGIEVFPVNVSELAKAEGGVTCCSLIFSIPDPS